MSILAYIKQTNTNNTVNPRVIEELINPYEKLIKQADYETAYNEFTSKEYKSKYTLAQYLRAQDSNRTVFGNLELLKPVSGVFLKETVQDNKIIFKATFGYVGEKSTQRIIIDAIQENGKFKLYNTYNSYVSIGGLLPVIY
jgi:hypothetical protein